MTKKILILIIIFIFLIGTAVFLYRNNFLRQDGSSGNGENTYDIRLYLMERNLFRTLENSNLPLNDINLTTEKSDRVSLSKIIQEKSHKFIFYAGLEYCNSCIEYQMPNVKWFSDQIDHNNVIIILHGLTRRDMYIIKQKYGIDCQLASTADSLGLPIEREYLPLFLVTDSMLVSKDVFVPLKESIEYNKQYLNLLIKKYWSKK